MAISWGVSIHLQPPGIYSGTYTAILDSWLPDLELGYNLLERGCCHHAQGVVQEAVKAHFRLPVMVSFLDSGVAIPPHTRVWGDACECG